MKRGTIRHTYQALISVVEVMWRFSNMIGLFDLSGGVLSAVTGSDTAIVTLLAKSTAEK